MALCLRPKVAALRSLQALRLSSYSSSTFPPPPPAASDGDGDGGGDKEDGAPPSYSSLFSEIKARLKQPSPPRRIPLSPADSPPPLGAVAPPPAAASLEEIRKNLSDFRLEKKPPPPSPSSSSPFSFQDLYRSNVLDKAENAPGGAPERPSFESIRESLRQLRASQPSSSSQAGFGSRIRGANQGGLSHPLDLKSLTDRLNLRPGEARVGGAESLPDSIFGRELLQKKKGEEEGEGRRGPAARKTEFLKMYDFEELGEKLRRLRPEEVGSGKKKGGWFSLEELNERLAKLRELEEKETEYSIGGVSFKDLRESLVKLRDADNKKTSSYASLHPLFFLCYCC